MSDPSKTAMQKWLRDEVVLAYDELKADPSSAAPIAQLRAGIAARRNPIREEKILTKA